MHPAEKAPLMRATIAQPHPPLGPRFPVPKDASPCSPAVQQPKDGQQSGQRPGQQRVSAFNG